MTALGYFERDHVGEADFGSGQRLIRLGDKGLSLSERLSTQFHQLFWRTPFHRLRLRGQFPLKLIALPADPLPGDAARGTALLEGRIRWGDEEIAVADVDFGKLAVSPGFTDYLQSFFWLRDLEATARIEEAVAIAERLMSSWLRSHAARVDKRGWRPDIWGQRVLLCASHARLILSSADLVYRSAVLNALARGGRHLDRSADRAPLGIRRVTAWAGVVAAGLIVQGGEERVARGEAGLLRALSQTLSSDGGMICRSPLAQLTLVELLAMLSAVYAAGGRNPPDFMDMALDCAAPALAGVMLGDGGLSSWQGGLPVTAASVAAALRAAGRSALPPALARDWGYQRIAAGQTIVIFDAGLPPVGRLESGGCASTLALEMSDGPHRLIVNCGGASASRLPKPLAEGLRTTAAHSTLTIADSNSTALNCDGSLGKGVVAVDFARLEHGGVEAMHDGYARRFGFVHHRRFELSGDGRELSGEDRLLPGETPRSETTHFAVRFHLGQNVDATLTADGAGALIRTAGGPGWQFRCDGAGLEIDDSIWIDAHGRPNPTRQLVLSACAAPGGAKLGWLFRRAG